MMALVGFLPADDLASSDDRRDEERLTDEPRLVTATGHMTGSRAKRERSYSARSGSRTPMALSDQPERARVVFERAAAFVNDVGLLAEEVDAETASCSATSRRRSATSAWSTPRGRSRRPSGAEPRASTTDVRSDENVGASRSRARGGPTEAGVGGHGRNCAAFVIATPEELACWPVWQNRIHVPDSDLARGASAWARAVEPDFLVNHSYRSSTSARHCWRARAARSDAESCTWRASCTTSRCTGSRRRDAFPPPGRGASPAAEVLRLGRPTTRRRSSMTPCVAHGALDGRRCPQRSGGRAPRRRGRRRRQMRIDQVSPGRARRGSGRPSRYDMKARSPRCVPTRGDGQALLRRREPVRTLDS